MKSSEEESEESFGIVSGQVKDQRRTPNSDKEMDQNWQPLKGRATGSDSRLSGNRKHVRVRAEQHKESGRRDKSSRSSSSGEPSSKRKTLSTVSGKNLSAGLARDGLVKWDALKDIITKPKDSHLKGIVTQATSSSRTRSGSPVSAITTSSDLEEPLEGLCRASTIPSGFMGESTIRNDHLHFQHVVITGFSRSFADADILAEINTFRKEIGLIGQEEITTLPTNYGFCRADLLGGRDVTVKLLLTKAKTSNLRYQTVLGRERMGAGQRNVKFKYLVTYLTAEEDNLVENGTPSLVLIGPGGSRGEDMLREQLLRDRIFELSGDKNFVLLARRQTEVQLTGPSHMLQLVSSKKNAHCFQDVAQQMKVNHYINGFPHECFRNIQGSMTDFNIAEQFSRQQLSYLIQGVSKKVKIEALYLQLNMRCQLAGPFIGLFPLLTEDGNQTGKWRLIATKIHSSLTEPNPKLWAGFAEIPGQSLEFTQESHGTEGFRLWNQIKATGGNKRSSTGAQRSEGFSRALRSELVDASTRRDELEKKVAILQEALKLSQDDLKTHKEESRMDKNRIEASVKRVMTHIQKLESENQNLKSLHQQQADALLSVQMTLVNQDKQISMIEIHRARTEDDIEITGLHSSSNKAKIDELVHNHETLKEDQVAMKDDVRYLKEKVGIREEQSVQGQDGTPKVRQPYPLFNSKATQKTSRSAVPSDTRDPMGSLLRDLLPVDSSSESGQVSDRRSTRTQSKQNVNLKATQRTSRRTASSDIRDPMGSLISELLPVDTSSESGQVSDRRSTRIQSKRTAQRGGTGTLGYNGLTETQGFLITLWDISDQMLVGDYLRTKPLPRGIRLQNIKAPLSVRKPLWIPSQMVDSM